MITGSKKGYIKFGSPNHVFTSIETPHPVWKRSNYEEERSLLKQKRTELNTSSRQVNLSEINLQEQPNQLKLTPSFRTTNSTDTTISHTASPEIVIVNPDPELVTCLDKIERLASVYSACIDKNLVPNIISELYFIFTVISSDYKTYKSTSDSTSASKDDKRDPRTNVKRKIHFTDKDYPSDGQRFDEFVIDKIKSMTTLYGVEDNSIKNDETTTSKPITSSDLDKVPSQKINKSVLGSVHNCVMFASIVVQKQVHVIQHLAKGVLRLLFENNRLTTFAPNVIPVLSQILKDQVGIKCKCLIVVLKVYNLSY